MNAPCRGPVSALLAVGDVLEEVCGGRAGVGHAPAGGVELLPGGVWWCLGQEVALQAVGGQPVVACAVVDGGDEVVVGVDVAQACVGVAVVDQAPTARLQAAGHVLGDRSCVEGDGQVPFRCWEFPQSVGVVVAWYESDLGDLVVVLVESGQFEGGGGVGESLAGAGSGVEVGDVGQGVGGGEVEVAAGVDRAGGRRREAAEQWGSSGGIRVEGGWFGSERHSSDVCMAVGQAGVGIPGGGGCARPGSRQVRG